MIHIFRRTVVNSLRSRCKQLIESGPYTVEDVEALVRAWDAEHGERKEVHKRALDLDRIVRDRMGLQRKRHASPFRPLPELQPGVVELDRIVRDPIGDESPPSPEPLTPEPALRREQLLAFMVDLRKRWIAAPTSADFFRWVDGEVARLSTTP